MTNGKRRILPSAAHTESGTKAIWRQRARCSEASAALIRLLCLIALAPMATSCSTKLDFGGGGRADAGTDGGTLAQGLLACPTNAAPPYTLAPARPAPEGWSLSERNAIITRGLAQFRKPDAFGNACANCHSPDGLELAVVAFTDADIVRHCEPRLTTDETADIVDYIHALRQRFAIGAPCSKLWRPFQPGGDPLPGTTTRDRDVAFANVLKSRQLRLATLPIRSLADAKAASTDLASVDLRRLPLPVAFPRLSEDAADGAEHRSFFDWIPGAGRLPKEPLSWYARHDRYLASPTIDNLAAIDAATDDETTQSKADVLGRPIAADFRAEYDAQLWMERTLTLKYKALLLGVHFFRLALLGQPGWLERPPLPFPELNRAYGPFFHMGLEQAESPCYGNGACDQQITSALPAFMKDEFNGLGVGQMSMQVLSDPWACLGELQDASLLTAQNTRGPTNTGFYWNTYTFEHRFIFQPFLNVHRLVTQQAYATIYRGTFRYPTALEAANPGAPVLLPIVPPVSTTPLLSGDWAPLESLVDVVANNDDPRLADALFIRANAALMIVYLQRDLLEQGAKVAKRTAIVEELNRYIGVAARVEQALGNDAWAKANPALAGGRDAFVTDLRRLVGEVKQLLAAATETMTP